MCNGPSVEVVVLDSAEPAANTDTAAGTARFSPRSKRPTAPSAPPAAPAAPSQRTISAKQNALKRTAEVNNLKRQLQRTNFLVSKGKVLSVVKPSPSTSATKKNAAHISECASGDYNDVVSTYASNASRKAASTPQPSTYAYAQDSYTSTLLGNERARKQQREVEEELTRKRKREDEDHSIHKRHCEEDRQRLFKEVDDSRARQNELDLHAREREAEARGLAAQASRLQTSFNHNLALQSAAHDQHQLMWGLNEARDRRIAAERRMDRQLEISAEANMHNHTERLVLKNAQPQMLSIATLGASNEDAIPEQY